jgi:hypothetical protein
MKCTRCGDELPSDTPICRQCGPPTFGSSPWASSSLPSLTLASASAAAAPPPVLPVAAPAVVSLPSSLPAVVAAPLAAVAVPAIATSPGLAAAAAAPAGPAAPVDPGRLTKQQKKERARQRLAERGLLKPEAKFGDAGQRTGADRKRESRQRQKEERAAAADDHSVPERFPLPRPVKLLAQVDVVMGLGCMLIAGGMMLDVPAAHAVRVAGGPLGIPLLLVLGLGFLVAAVSLMGLQPIGRSVQLALCAASPLLGGLNVLAAILIGLALLRPGVALLFSGRSPRSLNAEERQKVRDHEVALVLLRVAAVIQFLVLAYRCTPLLRM